MKARMIGCALNRPTPPLFAIINIIKFCRWTKGHHLVEWNGKKYWVNIQCVRILEGQEGTKNG